MANTKEIQIQALLDGAGKAGPELTHGLCSLGGGKMADGLVELWKAGQHNGVVKGAAITPLAFSAVIGGYILIKTAIEDRQMKKTLAEIKASVASRTADDESQVSGATTQNPPQGEDASGEEYELSRQEN